MRLFELDEVNVEMEEPAGVSVIARERSAHRRVGTTVVEEVATPVTGGADGRVEITGSPRGDTAVVSAPK